MAGTGEADGPGLLQWRTGNTGAICDLSGHFWTTKIAIHSGDLGATKLLVKAWTGWRADPTLCSTSRQPRAGGLRTADIYEPSPSSNVLVGGAGGTLHGCARTGCGRESAVLIV